MKKNLIRNTTRSGFILSTLLLCSAVEADNLVGLVGGQYTSNAALASQVLASGTLNDVPGLSSDGVINGVAVNSLGFGVIAGVDYNGSYDAFLVSPTGSTIPMTTTLTPFPNAYTAQGAAINNSGNGVVGGTTGNVIPIAYTFDSLGNTQLLTIPNPWGMDMGTVVPVRVNDAGAVLIGGADFINSAGYACYFDAGGSSFLLSPTTDYIVSVAINSSGDGIIGGPSDINTTLAYAAFVPSADPHGLVPLTLNNSANGYIQSVALNDMGNAILGGSNGTAAILYQATVAGPTVTQLDPGNAVLPANGVIETVAINSSGLGLVGGQNYTDLIAFTGPAVAFLVSADGTTITPLDNTVNPLVFPANGVIFTVAINDAGAGILGGVDYTNSVGVAYLYSPTTGLTPLTFSQSVSAVYSVAIVPFNIAPVVPMLSNIPTAGLHHNNLHYAKYINRYASGKAFYFVPSVLDGTLVQALESAAPTRNAFSLSTADNNLFFLNNSFSKHSHNSRLFRRQLSQTSQIAATEHPLGMDPDLLVASNGNHLAWGRHTVTSCREKKPKKVKECTVETDRPYQIWGDVLGSLAYQKKQHQTPAFDPATGAAILAFDVKATTHAYFGGGAAYAYTHIHEDKNAGHANINQEYLFIYGLWDNTRWYFDAALWAGLFQTENVRKIRMTGFEFQSKSHPKGWQLEPHFEVGYDVTSCTQRTTFEPFVMLDWISNWQRSYQETGSGPFNAGQKKHYSSFLRSEAGGRFYQAMRYCTWNLVFQEKLSYVNKKPFKVGTVHAFLVGAPGSFTVETLTTPQNLCVAELQMIFEPNDPGYPSGSIDYQLEYGSMYQSHVVSLNMNWNF